MMLAILGIFYATMVLAGYVVEFAFGGLGLVPAIRAAKAGQVAVQWNCFHHPQRLLSGGGGPRCRCGFSAPGPRPC